MHVEYYILHLSPIKHNINYYPSEDNKWGYEPSMFLIDDGHLCDIFISDNTDHNKNNSPESRYLVLSSLHIGRVK